MSETNTTEPQETPSTPPAPPKSTVDLEVKDANLIFTAAWNELEQEVGIEP